MDFFNNDEHGDDVLISNDNPGHQQDNNFDFMGGMGGGNNAIPAYDNTYAPMDGNVNVNVGIPSYGNIGFGEPADPEEEQRVKDRKREEDEKREKLVKKMNEEIERKQDNRNKAVEWTENTNNLYQKNIAKRKEFNKSNETDFLNNRDQVKQGKTNPWDVVIGTIDLRESEYKGTKDVSRMKNVIVTRKGDFSNLKMR